MATLKALVDETTVIKNDIRSCHVNLKNNLINKNIYISDSDKLPTLINKVADMSNIDIVVKSELPSTVKNGQIVVVSNKIPNKILFDFEYPMSNIENDIFIKIQKDISGKKFIIGNYKNSVNIYIFGVQQYIGGSYKRIESYIGENGKWIGMNNYYLVDSYNKMDVTNMYDIVPHSRTTTSIEDNCTLVMVQNPSSSSRGTGGFKTKDKIDLSLYKKIICKCWITTDFYAADNKFILRVANDDGGTIAYTEVISKTISDRPTKEATLELDISAISDSYKVHFEAYAYGGITTTKILESYAE